MNKQKPLILEIPKPCNESWAEMTPMGLGRFCAHCQKTVTDISQMSDAQVLQLFQRNPDTHCIRAFASQLNRPINLPIQEPTRFYRIAVALGLTLVMAVAADTYARPRPPLVEQNYLLADDDSAKKENVSEDTLVIRGVVLDETNNPFPGVVVKLMQGGLIKGGTVTEDDGSFEIKSYKKLARNEFSLEFSSNGYITNLISGFNTNFKNYGNIKVKMVLKRKYIMMGALIQIYRPFEKSGNKKFYSEDLNKMGF